jgi:hypothetical protein
MLRSSAFAPRKKNSHKADFYLRAPSFLQWLRGRNCLLCDKGGCEGRIEAAHVDYAGGKGVGIKVADRFSIPLCSAHHRAQHNWAGRPSRTISASMPWRRRKPTGTLGLDAGHGRIAVPDGHTIILRSDYTRMQAHRLIEQAPQGAFGRKDLRMAIND